MIIKGKIGNLKIIGSNNIIIITRDIINLNLTGSSNKIYLEKNISNIIFNGSNNVIKMRFSQFDLSRVDYGQNNKILVYRLSLQNNLDDHYNEEESEKKEDEKNNLDNGTPVNKTPIRRMDAINNNHFSDYLNTNKNRCESEKLDDIISQKFCQIQSSININNNISSTSTIINTNIANNTNINNMSNNNSHNENSNNNYNNSINTINDDNEINIDDYIDRDINAILLRSHRRPASHGRLHRRSLISPNPNQGIRNDNTENDESKLFYI